MAEVPTDPSELNADPTDDATLDSPPIALDAAEAPDDSPENAPVAFFNTAM